MGKTLVGPGSLSPFDEVDAVPVWRELHPGEGYAPDAWWGLPVWVVREFIRKALARGRYVEAGRWSAAIAERAVVGPRS